MLQINEIRSLEGMCECGAGQEGLQTPTKDVISSVRHKTRRSRTHVGNDFTQVIERVKIAVSTLVRR